MAMKSGLNIMVGLSVLGLAVHAQAFDGDKRKWQKPETTYYGTVEVIPSKDGEVTKPYVNGVVFEDRNRN